MIKDNSDFCILSYNNYGYYYINTLNTSIENKKSHMTRSKNHVV